MASIGTDKGDDGQATIAQLEHQLGQLKRRLATARERQLQRLERQCGQATTRIDRLRQQYAQARDRVAIARQEARIKSNLTADRQLQRAQARAAQLKAALDAARDAEGQLKHEFRQRRNALRMEARIARSLERLHPARPAARSSSTRNGRTSEPGSKPKAPGSGSSRQSRAAPDRSTRGNSGSRPVGASPSNLGEASDTGSRDHQPRQTALSEPPSALEPAGGETLVNQVRRKVATDLREMSDARPAAAVVKMSTRVAPETVDPPSGSTAPRPAPVSIPPTPPATDSGPAETPGQRQADSSRADDADSDAGAQAPPRVRAKPRGGHVRSLFDLLDE